MADDFKDPKKLFDPKNISEANSAIRALADNANNLKRVSEEFGDAFGRSFVNKVNQVSRDFDNLAGRANDFRNLEVSRSEAMRMQKKLSLDLNKLATEESELREKVENTLRKDADKSQEVYDIAKANLENLVARGRVSKNQLENAEARAEAAKKIRDHDSAAYEIGQAALANLAESIRRGETLVAQTGDYVANFNKARLASGLLGRSLEGLKKIPFIGDLIDADTMLNVMNNNLIKGDGLFKAFGKGVSAAFKGIEKSTIILALIAAVVKAIKFVISLAAMAQGQVVQIAKNLNITQDSANEVVGSFAEIARNSSNIRVNIKALTEAQADFTKSVGATTIMSADLLESQVFLKKNLGLSGEQASALGQMFNIMGGNSEDVLESVIGTNNASAKTQGYLIPTNILMSKIASAGAEISTYFGNNVKSLAAGVKQVTKFGLELQQAASISKSLLDFESSISNELNAEILLGKDFNFERARSLALQGKFGDATEEVMSQMQDLTEEQRRNPIYLEAAAKAAGLSTEELAKSFQIQKSLNISAQEYGKLQARAGAIGQEALLNRLGLQGASREQIEKTLTAQEAFSLALEKAKEQFAELVGSGALEALTDVILDFAATMKNFGFGKERSDRSASEKATSLRKEKGVDIQAIDDAEKSAKKRLGFFESLTIKMVGLQSPILKGLGDLYATSRNAKADLGKKRLEGGAKNFEVEDFTISTHPKDTLVMAGGTKLGGDQEALLTELKSVNKNLDELRKKEGTVYIGGNKAGMALGMATYSTP